MKVLRFMSGAEFAKYRAGKILKNTKEHAAKTDAIGFCFLDADDYDAQYALHFLSGLVNQDVVAIFETDAKLKEGSGTFADPHGSFFQSMEVTEHSITSYSNKNFKLVKFCDNFENNYKEDSFDRVFEWKSPDQPFVRHIRVVEQRSPEISTNVPHPEHHLANAILAFVNKQAKGQFDLTGFKLAGNADISLERSMTEDNIKLEVMLTRHTGFPL